ncbi:MAG: hypothetical protein ACYCV0_02530 [Desulfitobacteriaceae bacterium]
MIDPSIVIHQGPLPRRKLDQFFINTGFYDLLPLALKMAESLGYDQTEMIEAICKVNDKFCRYPPTQNRTAWFRKVFEEKLQEARGDILTFRAQMERLGQ